MSTIAILLLMVAAFLHAGWNLFSKRSNPSPAFMLVANTLGCLVLVPVVLFDGAAYARFPREVWVWAWLTGICQAVYFTGLAHAYRRGDMSIVYPLARSSPLIVVTITSVLLGRRDQIGIACVIGVVLIVTGCFLLPMKRFRDLNIRNHLNAAFLFAILAAFGTAGYSLIDDEALRCLRTSLAVDLSNVRITILYAFAEALTTSVWLGAFVICTKDGRRELGEVWRDQRGSAFLAGIVIFITYTIVLISFAYVRNVSYAVGFRQLSIPIGAIFGMVLLREARPVPKIVGIAVLFAGLLILALG